MSLRATLGALFALGERDWLLPELELTGWSQEAAAEAFGRKDAPRCTLLRATPEADARAAGTSGRDLRVYRREVVWIDVEELVAA